MTQICTSHVIQITDRLTINDSLLKQIHVNQHVIRANKKHNRGDPVISVRHKKQIYRCKQVNIDGPSAVTYSPDSPLSCGARVWIETNSPITIN